MNQTAFNFSQQDTIQQETKNYIGQSEGPLLNSLLYYRLCFEVVKESGVLRCTETGLTEQELHRVLSNLCNNLEALNYVCRYTRSIL